MMRQKCKGQCEKKHIDGLVKNEPPEDSFEDEDNETLSEKTFETFDQTNVLERESFENLKTLNYGEIPDAKKSEDIEPFAETRFQVPEQSPKPNVEANSAEKNLTSPEKKIMCRICSSSHLDENRLHIHLIMFHFKVCVCNSGY